MDAWTEKQIDMMREGGNVNFKTFMENYELNRQPPAIKYKTVAAEYYRRKVRVSG